MAICIFFFKFPRHLQCTVIAARISFLLIKKAKKHNFLMLIHPLYLLMLLAARKYPGEEKKKAQSN